MSDVNSPAGSPKKVLLILKAKADSLKNAESFLNARDWEVISATTVPEAIALIISRSPDYALLAVDHPNRKVKSLPKVLSQAFPIKLIAFCESQAPASIAAMHEVGLPFQIFPPISGPAIERMILKIQKEEFSSPQKTDLNLQQSPAALSVLQQLMNSKETHDDADPKADVAYMPNHQVSTEPESQTSAYIPPQYDNKPKDNESFFEWEERIRREKEANFQHLQDSAAGKNDIKAKANLESDSKNNHSQNAIVLPGEVKAKEKIAYNTTVPGRRVSQLNMDSIIVKGTQAAFDGAIKNDIDKDPIETLDQSSNTLCIIIESPRFSGYLVAALGNNRKFDQSFIETVRVRLFEFLRSQGENPGKENSLDLKLRPIEFEEWALEHAEFLRKSIHNGDEIAMAFFPTTKTSPELAESAREDMVSISIDELKGDVAVLFDIYIYLPANKKYILYTPQGGTFLTAQKDRMVQKGISHMHMRKDQVTAAKKYTAQNYLNEKIDEFIAEKEASEKKKAS